MSEAAEDLLKVVRLLVDDPRAVRVEEEDTDEGPELWITVTPADRGKVIGRNGRTIDAVRALADARGAREGRDYAVEVSED